MVTKKTVAYRSMSFLLCVLFLFALTPRFTLSAKAAAIDVTGDYTITSGGEYQLTSGATSPLKGATAAHLLTDALIVNTTEPVTIIGDRDGHENLRIVCAVAGVDL